MNISIIIPIYNVEAFIGKCIASVMAQTYSEGVECILVNDCTPDGSIRIAQQMIDDYVKKGGAIKFSILSHEQNQGIGVARMTGINAAQGDYVIHLDSDDYWEVDLLESMYGEALAKDADIVGCDYIDEYENDRVVRRFIFKDNLDCLREILAGNYTVNLWRRLCRRSLYTDNPIVYKREICYGEDAVWTIQLHYYAQTVAHVPKPLYHYVHLNANSYTASMSPEKVLTWVEAWRTVEIFFKEKGIYERYKPYFLYKVFIAKNSLILDVAIRDYKLWKSIYPESHRYIEQYPYSRVGRLCFQLIAIGLGRIVFPLIDMKRKCIKQMTK